MLYAICVQIVGLLVFMSAWLPLLQPPPPCAAVSVVGIPFMYRGLPCIYSSAILACVSLLSGGNTAVLRVTAIAMILFMVSQSFYPHDRVLESQAWKKVVYAGGTKHRMSLTSIKSFCLSVELN